MLPTLRPTVTHDVDQLDAQLRQALLAFIGQGDRVRSAVHPEAMNYVFELEEAGAAARKLSCAFSAIPATLHVLLPRKAGGREAS
jgi:hypothetical protein